MVIGNSQKIRAVTLRFKRWSGGVTSEVNIPVTSMGDFTATALYQCSKSDGRQVVLSLFT